MHRKTKEFPPFLYEQKLAPFRKPELLQRFTEGLQNSQHVMFRGSEQPLEHTTHPKAKIPHGNLRFHVPCFG